MLHLCVQYIFYFEQCFPGCNAQADIVFLVDSSGSVGRDIFARLLDFVNRVVDEMNVASNYTRVGLVSFSNRAWISFLLDK